ncbi:PAQR family membrane homeostasis protein TrhA [Profundibacterium mesophilum]|nr:hemolysin III family protein [Profundibacterium mesophilum]
MKPARLRRAGYSLAERRSDSVIHVIGVGAALLGVPILIMAVISERGDTASLVAISIYGASLLAMLGCSALYNTLPAPNWRPVLKRMDHSAIYIKIAGTFTPLVALSEVPGTGLLIGLWLAALAGAMLKIASPDRLRWLGLTLYLGMGWGGVALGGEVFGALSPAAFAMVTAGGLLYTAGVVFFLWEALPFHYTIWHVFVLAATLLFFGAVLTEI